MFALTVQVLRLSLSLGSVPVTVDSAPGAARTLNTKQKPKKPLTAATQGVQLVDLSFLTCSKHLSHGWCAEPGAPSRCTGTTRSGPSRARLR